jgi:phospholipid/cholesterol/gamma-HCH transport system substrate-binding protein
MDSSSVKVGGIVLLGLALLVGLVVYLTRYGVGWRSTDFYIAFTDARGIQPGAPVRLAGVEIGKVTAVELRTFPDYPTRQAAVRVRVRGDALVRKGDRYKIGSGLLIADRFIEIAWAAKPSDRVRDGDVVPGSVQVELGELVPEAKDIMGRLKKIGSDIEALSGDVSLREDIASIIRNLNTTTSHTARLAERLAHLVEANQGNVNAMASNLARSSQDLRATAAHVRRMVEESPAPEDMAEMAKSLRQAAEHVAVMAESVRGLTTDPTMQEDLRTTVANLRHASEQMAQTAESVRGLAEDPQMRDDARATLASLRQASASAEEMTRSLKDLTTDQKVQQDLRSAIGNLREASESAKAAAQHGESVLQRMDRTTSRLPRLDVSTGLMTQYSPDRGAWRTDANVSVWQAGRAGPRYILGWRDIGEGNKVNAQWAWRSADGDWLRAGLFASKLGVGYDRVFGPRLGLTGELYDPNDLTLDLKGFYHRSPDDNWRLLVGVDRLMKANDFVVGADVRY